jgi:hypothetical protein
MRSKLIGLLLGLSLAAVVTPALACDFQTTSASNDKTASQQTAQSPPSSDVGSN